MFSPVFPRYKFVGSGPHSDALSVMERNGRQRSVRSSRFLGAISDGGVPGTVLTIAIRCGIALCVSVAESATDNRRVPGACGS
jgi:hypothetical protein